MSSDDMIELYCEIVRETDKAIGIKSGTLDMDLGDGKSKLVWLPKSQIDWDEDEGVVYIPQWLAEDKGLI